MTDIAYAIGLFLFIVFIMIIKILISCCATGPLSPGRTNQISNFTSVDQHSINTIELGLDEATLRNYPKLMYAQAKLHKGNSTSSCCSICLADYKDTDMLRLLPDCGHLFHVKCVDPWFQQHPTCPVCRNSPLVQAATSVDINSWPDNWTHMGFNFQHKLMFL